MQLSRWTTSPWPACSNETADLMEIDGADSFRVRSYRNAADASRTDHG